MNFHLDEIRWFVYGFAGLLLIGSGMALYFLARGWQEVKTIYRDIVAPFGWRELYDDMRENEG